MNGELVFSESSHDRRLDKATIRLNRNDLVRQARPLCRFELTNTLNASTGQPLDRPPNMLCPLGNRFLEARQRQLAGFAVEDGDGVVFFVDPDAASLYLVLDRLAHQDAKLLTGQLATRRGQRELSGHHGVRRVDGFQVIGG